MGFDIDLDASSATTDTPARDVTSEAREEPHSGCKKPRLSSDVRQDFQLGYKVFVTWADDAEKALDEVSIMCYK